MKAFSLLGIGIFTTTAPLLAEIFPGWIVPPEAETQNTKTGVSSLLKIIRFK